MFRLWFDREVPPDLDAVIGGRATSVGPGAAPDPLATLEGADAIVASSLMDFDAAVFDRAPDLRVIARTGIGVDRVDVAEASRRGIVVCNAPDAPSVSTAEHALALLLAVAKGLKRAEARLHRGETDHFASHEGVELAGLRLGVVGFGRIGGRVAALATALGMEVVAFDPWADVAGPSVDAASSLQELLASTDAVSLHLPLTPETRHMIDAEALGTMRPGALLVNTARGGLVDHVALLEALEAGRLGGAGLDVTEPEPLPPGHPLLARGDVVVTPHVAAATTAAKRRLYETAVGQALDVLERRRPAHVVNPEVLEGIPAEETRGA